MNNILVILGNDKLGGIAYENLKNNHNVSIVIDRSLSTKKVLKLIAIKSLNISSLFKMIISELIRKGCKPPIDAPGIKNNFDLTKILNVKQHSKIILFRAGLIIGEEVLNKDIPVFNVHAAKIPMYGGLCSIDKAIINDDLNQSASFHRVTSRIDEGELLDSEQFMLDRTATYAENESIAYLAALELLYRNTQ